MNVHECAWVHMGARADGLSAHRPLLSPRLPPSQIQAGLSPDVDQVEILAGTMPNASLEQASGRGGQGWGGGCLLGGREVGKEKERGGGLPASG